MGNKVKDIFYPTKEEQINFFEFVMMIRQDQIGCCSTCAHYSSSDMPGFVTDYGTCQVNSSIFTKKVCSQEKIECSFYSEETEIINKLNNLIAELKGK